MTTTTMPYFWRMYQLERFNWSTGRHFFSTDSKRFFSSRIQTVPPYGGRVFVTSEQMRNWGAGIKKCYSTERRYSVRCIRPDGGIESINPDPTFKSEAFQYFATRHDAHVFAKAYAAANFARVGNESVQLPKEIIIV